MIKFHRLDTETVFRIHHYREIRKVVNGHKSAAHTDSPDGGTGKTSPGGGIHCPSASSNEEISPSPSDSHFPGEPGLASSSWFSSFTCPRRELLGDKWHGFV